MQISQIRTSSLSLKKYSSNVHPLEFGFGLYNDVCALCALDDKNKVWHSLVWSHFVFELVFNGYKGPKFGLVVCTVDVDALYRTADVSNWVSICITNYGFGLLYAFSQM